jgi:hypothetical protein
MSYSVGFLGTPEEVVKQLDGQSSILSGESKEEYDAVLPSLIGLVKQNSDEPNRKVRITASGHAYTNQEGKKVSQCLAQVELAYDQI